MSQEDPRAKKRRKMTVNGKKGATSHGAGGRSGTRSGSGGSSGSDGYEVVGRKNGSPGISQLLTPVSSSGGGSTHVGWGGYVSGLFGTNKARRD